MKQTMFFLIVTISTVVFAEPVRSMLGADGSSMVQTDGHDLPDGIVEVEFLESTGTQWIDTGYVVSSSSSSIWDVQVIQYNDASIGSRDIKDALYYLNFYGSKFFPRYGRVTNYSNGIPSPIWSAYGRNVVCYSGGSVIVNGKEVETGKDISALDHNSKSIFLFYFNTTTQSLPPFIGRIFRFSILEDNICTLDLIPVRFLNENDEWEGAMYDLVSQSLFTNLGTGSFVIGPDVEE